MKITQAHLHFWERKKGVAVPKWATGLESAPEISIHTLINAQVPSKKLSNALNNTLVLLHFARKRGSDSLKQTLYRMATDPQTTIDPKRRAGYCRKWLEKMSA